MIQAVIANLVAGAVLEGHRKAPPPLRPPNLHWTTWPRRKVRL